MNELDAGRSALADAENDVNKLSDALSPDEVRRRMEIRLLFRLQRFSFEGEEAAIAARESFRKPLPNRPNTSLIISKRLIDALVACSEMLSFEVRRALLSWLCGSPLTGSGYAQRMFETFPDSGTVTAISELEGMVTKLRKGMAQYDQKLFIELLPTLPESNQKLIQGLLLEARWAKAEEDGDRMALRQRTARRLTHLLVTKRARNLKVYPEA